MKKGIMYVVSATILLGVIGLSLNWVFGVGTITYISQININGVYMYKYDFFKYIDNLYNTFMNVAELKLVLPEQTWMTATDITNWFPALANNLGYILNIIIIGLNVLLYPIRVIFYVVQVILSIIGIPTVQGTYEGNPLEWLISTAKVLTSLQIPYVNQPS